MLILTMKALHKLLIIVDASFCKTFMQHKAAQNHMAVESQRLCQSNGGAAKALIEELG